MQIRFGVIMFICLCCGLLLTNQIDSVILNLHPRLGIESLLRTIIKTLLCTVLVTLGLAKAELPLDLRCVLYALIWGAVIEGIAVSRTLMISPEPLENIGKALTYVAEFAFVAALASLGANIILNKIFSRDNRKL